MSLSPAASALGNLAPTAASLLDRLSKPKTAATGTDPQAVAAKFQQKNELQQLRAEFRDKVLKERHVGDKELAHLSDSARADFESALGRQVDQRIQSSLQSKAASGGPATAQVLDIKV